jgi:hypothetical protein
MKRIQQARWLALLLALATASASHTQSPHITSFTPDSGPPGTLVKVIGERLDTVTEAYVGGIPVTDLRPVSDLHLKLVVPEGARTGPIGLVDRQGLRTYTLRAFEVSLVGASTPPLYLAYPRPTPAAGSVTIGFSLSSTGPARLRIFDIAGKAIRTLADQRFAAGPVELRWDGRDDRSRAVGSGLYVARLEVEGRSLVRHIVLIR